MRHLWKGVFVTTVNSAEIFISKYTKSWSAIFYYGMVSLGQYVVNCWFTTGSKIFTFNRGQRTFNETHCNHQERNSEQNTLHVEELFPDDRKFYCKQKRCPKVHFNYNYNNPQVHFSTKNEEVKNVNVRNECYCRNPQIQFGRPNKKENALKNRSSFHHNEDQFLCGCTSSEDRNDIQKNGQGESYDIGCGIISFFSNLFSSSRSSTQENESIQCQTRSCVGRDRGIFSSLENQFCGSNNSTSIEENDNQIFYISTECATENICSVPKRKNNSKKPYHVGCDNISFETELVSSMERKSNKNSKLVKKQNDLNSSDIVKNDVSSTSHLIDCVEPQNVSSSELCNLPV